MPRYILLQTNENSYLASWNSSNNVRCQVPEKARRKAAGQSLFWIRKWPPNLHYLNLLYILPNTEKRWRARQSGTLVSSLPACPCNPEGTTQRDLPVLRGEWGRDRISYEPKRWWEEADQDHVRSGKRPMSQSRTGNVACSQGSRSKDALFAHQWLVMRYLHSLASTADLLIKAGCSWGHHSPFAISE